MERILCCLLLVLLLCLSPACQTDDDDDDDSADDDDTDDDDDVSPPTGDPTPLLVASQGRFLIFYNLYNVDPPPQLLVDTDEQFVEQVLGGLTGERYLDIAVAPSSSVDLMTGMVIYDVQDARMAVDDDGFVHLFYQTITDSALHYGTTRGGAWAERELSINEDTSVDRLRFAVDTHNRPHFFYRTGEDESFRLHHLRQTGAVWRNETIYEGNFGEYNVVLDAQDAAYIVLRNDDEPTAILTGSDAGDGWNWSATLPMYETGFFSPLFGAPQIAMTSAGQPAVAVVYYGDFYDDLITDVWYGERSGTGLSLKKIWMSTEYAYDQLALGMDDAGTPHLVLPGEETVHLHRVGAAWPEETIAFNAEKWPMMAGDETGRLHVVGYGRPKPTQQYSVLYQRWKDEEWEYQLRIGAENFAVSPPLTMVLDSQSVPRFFCSGLRYGVGPAGSWTVEKIDLHYGNSLFHNFLLDENDQPHLVYVPGYAIGHTYQDGDEWVSEFLYEDDSPSGPALDDDVIDDDCYDDDVEPYADSLAAEWDNEQQFRMVMYSGWRRHLELFTWQDDVYEPENVFAFSPTQPSLTQILVDQNGDNHIFLRRYNSMEYFTDAAGDWTHEELPADFNHFEEQTNGFQAVIDDNNILHLAYYDQTDKQMVYASGTAGDWETTYPDEGRKCKAPRVQFDATQTLHILCQASEHMVHFVDTPEGWETEELPLVADELNFDFAIDDQGELLLLYEYAGALLFTIF